MRLLRGIATLSGGALAARAVSFLTIPLIARLYEPSAVGSFSMAVAIATLAAPALSLSYNLAMPLPRRDETARSLAILSLLAAIAGGSALFGGAWIATTLVGRALIPGFDGSFIVVIAGLTFLTVALDCFVMWTTRKRHYRTIATTQISKAAVGELSKVGLGWVGAGAGGLLLGHLAGFLAAIAIAVAPYACRLSTPWLPPAHRLWATARNYMEYPIARMPAQLLSAYGVQSPVLWIGAGYAPDLAGQFGMALMILSLPINLLGQSVSRSLFAELAAMRNARTDIQTIRQLVRRVAISTSIMAAPISIAIAALSKPAFSLVLGLEWAMAGEICSTLAIYTFLQFVSYPLLTIFNFAGGQAELLKIHFQRSVLVSLLLMGCLAFHVPFSISIWLYSATLSGHYVLVLLRVWRHIRVWNA